MDNDHTPKTLYIPAEPWPKGFINEKIRYIKLPMPKFKSYVDMDYDLVYQLMHETLPIHDVNGWMDPKIRDVHRMRMHRLKLLLEIEYHKQFKKLKN